MADKTLSDFMPKAPAESGIVQVMTDERTNTTFTETVKFRDFEELLTRRFGERFRVYRENYRKSLNYDKNGYVAEFPLTVTLELVNRCNLNCVMCYTINHAEMKSTLGAAQISQVLQECEAHGLPALVIGLGSEPLLHKGARDIISEAAEKGVMDIFLGTNGVLLTPEMSDFLVANQIARVEVSVDAASRDTYRRVRGKDEYERVTHNIRSLIEAKKRSGSDLPVIRLCFCVQDINRHERKAFLELWGDEVDYVDFQEMIDFSDIDSLRETGTVPDVETIDVPEPHCAYPFNSLHIWANGDVTPCCTFFAKSPELNLGNIADASLNEMWHGDKIKEIRQQLLSGDLNPTCRVCLGKRDAENFDAVKAENRDEGRTD